jgi:uncharacterized protein
MIHPYGKLGMTLHLIAALALVLCSLNAVAGGEQWVPQLEGRVTDTANVLPLADRDRLAQMLARYEQETTHQFAVLIVPNLSGESIESLSLRVANAWGLGQKGLNNGVLVTVAVEERQVRIEVGLGMEGYITHAMAQSAINTVIVPAFRQGNYAGGLQSGLERLMTEGRRFVVTPADMQRAKAQ